MKFGGLLAMEAPIAHITQQTSLIGSFQNQMIHMSSLSRQRGVTEVQLKRVVSIPSPNGKRMNQQP